MLPSLSIRTVCVWSAVGVTTAPGASAAAVLLSIFSSPLSAGPLAVLKVTGWPAFGAVKRLLADGGGGKAPPDRGAKLALRLASQSSKKELPVAGWPPDRLGGVIEAGIAGAGPKAGEPNEPGRLAPAGRPAAGGKPAP